MDYRYYRGDGWNLPPAITRHLHYLRTIGTLMIILPPILALFMLLQVIKLSLFWFFASFLLGSFGNVFYIIGMTFDTTLDRENAPGFLSKVFSFGSQDTPKKFRPERRMIYDHYEVVESFEEE